MKNLIKISVLIMLIALASCSSNSFSKRKYQKGVFKEHSVRVRRDKSKAEETFFTSKSELKTKEHQKEPTLLESATIIQNDTLHTTAKDFKIDERRSGEKHLNKSAIIKQHKVATKNRRKTNQEENKLSKVSKITGWVSIVIIAIIIGLLILFIFFFLNLIAILILAILLALLFILNLILTIKIKKELKYKAYSTLREKDELRRTRLINIIALILIGLILVAFLIGGIIYFFLGLFEVV